jgi:hypothetical protein
VLKSPAELLDLKICDPAMGSGAFLVQVCRWLADRLVEAWSLAETFGKSVSANGEVFEAKPERERLPRDVETRTVIARRLISERCLYGVDLNPLAVELAKLSIWLVTLAKGRPFGFLDHNFRCGDSLLGIRRLDQLTEFKMAPDAKGQQRLFGKSIEQAVQGALELRQQLREMPMRDIHDVEAMARLDSDIRRRLKVLGCIADAFMGEVLVAGANVSILDGSLESLAIEASQSIVEDLDAITAISKRAKSTLAIDLPISKASRKPIHWPLEFPEVFSRDQTGFDAIIGNPPFLGGRKITGTLGDLYREHLVLYIANGDRGSSADLVVYFFLRAHALLRNCGCFGLIAVNTIAEGDSRQVGLERLLKSKAEIFSATPNEPWPGKAAVVTSRIHIIKGAWRGKKFLAQKEVPVISAFLSSQDEWSPKALKANAGQSFQGSIVLGLGFILSNSDASRMLISDPTNSEVIFPYLNGDDLNSNPTHQPSRWVINFWDWPEDRAEKYRLPYEWIVEHVKPERQRLNEDGTFVLRNPLPIRWWQYADKRPALYHAIGRGDYFERHPENWHAERNAMKRVIAISRHTKFFNPVFISNTDIASDATVILAFSDFNHFAWLNSTVVQVWVQKMASFIGMTIRFTPSDCFDTLPKPFNMARKDLRLAGEAYHDLRSQLMVNSGEGLTQIYNRFHNPDEQDVRIGLLREKQMDVDNAVIDAYGWNDIDLEYGFYKIAYLPDNDKQRFTISEFARIEVLRRLSEINRLRYQQEVAQGLHGEGSKKSRTSASKKKSTEAVEQSDFDFNSASDIADPSGGVPNNFSPETNPEPAQ